MESEHCPGFTESVKAGKPTLVQVKATLADGLAVPLIGVNSFKTAYPLIDKMVKGTKNLHFMKLKSLNLATSQRRTNSFSYFTIG